MRATAQTVRVETIDAPDLLPYFMPDDGVYFEHPGRAIVTVGSARALSIPGGPDLVARASRAASDALRDADDAIVVGALPFDEHAPATLTVPQIAIVRNGGTKKITIGEAREIVARPVESHAHGELKITAVPEPAAYMASVAEARERLARGMLDKVVLARMLIAQSDHAFDRRALLARLRAAEPNAYTFAAGGFIGASPELLISKHGDRIRARPLAGTTARGADEAADKTAARALASSPKELHEHALVVDAVREALEPVCARLEVDAAPSLVSTSKVWHLATEVRGELREPLDVLALAARLHPTPAVCGTPRERARETIRELEQIDRTLYAGLVGWMDARGDGEWALVLRCAEMQGRIALLFAGAGIVAGSDPAAELAETDAKFRSMLEALGYA